MKDRIGQDIQAGDYVAHAGRTSTTAFIQPAIVLKLTKQETWGREVDAVRIHSYGSSRAGTTFPDRLIKISKESLSYDIIGNLGKRYASYRS